MSVGVQNFLSTVPEMAMQSNSERQGLSCATMQSVSCDVKVGGGVPCFTSGTRIATDCGDRLIEEICIGDRVFTRDHGMRPVRWIGSRTVSATDQFAPVQIKPGVFNGMTSSLTVSQQHRVMFSGYRSQLLFGVSEVLVSAKDLVDGVAVDFQSGGDVTYIHLMFDSHEIIYANGVPTESFHLDCNVLRDVDSAAREELLAVFPDLRTGLSGLGAPARRCLTDAETKMLQM